MPEQSSGEVAQIQLQRSVCEALLSGGFGIEVWEVWGTASDEVCYTKKVGLGKKGSEVRGMVSGLTWQKQTVQAPSQSVECYSAPLCSMTVGCLHSSALIGALQYLQRTQSWVPDKSLSSSQSTSLQYKLRSWNIICSLIPYYNSDVYPTMYVVVCIFCSIIPL